MGCSESKSRTHRKRKVTKKIIQKEQRTGYFTYNQKISPVRAFNLLQGIL